MKAAKAYLPQRTPFDALRLLRTGILAGLITKCYDTGFSESYSGQGTQEKTFKPGREQVLKKRCFFTAEVAEGR